MKKMFTTIALILLICGIIAGMFSCWEMPEMQYGVVTVMFNLNNTKAITYDWDMVESGKVFLKQGGITKFEADITLDKTAKTGSCMLNAIPYGGYDIVVELYDTQGLIFYIGEDDVTIDDMDNGVITIVLERNAGILSASGTWTEDIPGIYSAEMHLIQDDSMESSTNMSIDTGLKTVSGNIDNIYPGSYEINVLIKDQENNILFEGSTLYTIDKGDNIALLTLIFQTGSVEIQISGDVTAPAIEEPGPSYSVNGTNVTVTWTTNENATSNICWSETEGFDYKTQLNWAPVGRDIVADNTSHSVDITGLTEGNTYYYVVYTADESGNVRVSDEGSIVVAVNRIYVANGGSKTISVIDGSSDVVIDTSDLEYEPYAIAINTVTGKIYVCNYGSNNVSVIDADTYNEVATIPVESNPVSVAVNSNTNRIYVSNLGSHSVSVIDGYTDSVIETIPLPGSCQTLGIVVNPVTNKVYLADLTVCNGTGNIAVIDGFTNTLIKKIPVGMNPSSLSVNPVTNRIYAGDVGASSTNAIRVIDGESDTVIRTIVTSSYELVSAVNPITNLLYIVDFNDGVVNVYDGDEDTYNLIDTILVGYPNGLSSKSIAINPNTNKIYVGHNHAGIVTVIDGVSNTVLTEITVGVYPGSITIFP